MNAATQRAAATQARRTAAAARATADRDRAQQSVSRPLAEGFSAITHALSAPADLDEAYLHAVRRAHQLIAGAAWVSLSIRNDGRAQTASSTHELAADLDRVQYDSHAGPCLQAMADNNLVLSDDLARDRRWPAFAAAAVAAAVDSVLSVPVPQAARAAQASRSINNYGNTPSAFTEESVQVATVLAAHLAALIAVAASAPATTRHLGQAVQARDVIGQAKGMLIGRRGLTAEQAFGALRVAVVVLNRTLCEATEQTPAD